MEIEEQAPPSRKLKLKKCGLVEGCELIENYRNLNKIHQGTYGVVFRALELPTDKVRAIKKINLSATEDFPITSLREIAILRSLSHPNICSITRVATSADRGNVYIVMEYVEH